MTTKIQLTPGELKAQAAEMKALEAEYSSLFAGVTSELKKINGNWSPNLSNNFEGKINSAQKSFMQITQELMNGSKVADTCAVTFETVDSQLAKLYCSEESIGGEGSVGDLKEKAEAAAKLMDWAKGEWIDEYCKDMPLWMRESFKKTLKDVADGLIDDNFSDAYDISQKILDGEYLDALKDVVGVFYKEDGFFKGLQPKFFINSAFGMIEEYIDYCKDPSLVNLISIGWEGTVGAVLETAGDAAWSVVKYIPGVSDWYDKHGVDSAGEAFNVAYTETVRAIFGDDMADYVGSYYAENGGLFRGLVNGFRDIKDYVEDACDRNGGIIGIWKSGWNSIFN